MSEQQAPEHFADWNEQMVQRYDPGVFEHHPRGVVRWVEAKRVRAVVRKLASGSGHRVLDVGCGTGHLLKLLNGAEKHGIDLSKTMVGRAQQHLGAAAKIVLGDAEKLPYETASFDRVLASSMLSHVLHPEQVVEEMRRVLKPGGRIVISVCLEEQIERGLRWTKALGFNRFLLGHADQPQVYSVEYHMHHFTRERLREVVSGRLREMSLTRVPLIFPVHLIAVYEKGESNS